VKEGQLDISLTSYLIPIHSFKDFCLYHQSFCGVHLYQENCCFLEYLSDFCPVVLTLSVYALVFSYFFCSKCGNLKFNQAFSLLTIVFFAFEESPPIEFGYTY
jgi:hypothetical protein